MMRPQIFTCFGLVIHGLSLPQALAQLDEQAKAGKQSMVVTANPEILLSAKKNPAYWNVLRQADLRRGRSRKCGQSCLDFQKKLS